MKAVKTVRLAERQATILWQGDVVVLGAGLAGLTAALEAARAGRKTCLVESGPVLGRELSRLWQTELPDVELCRQLRALSAAQGVPAGARADVFVGTLAFDRLVAEAGIEALVRVIATRPVTDAAGKLIGVEVVGKSGRQLVQAPRVIDATPERRFSRRVAGAKAPTAKGAVRRFYVHGVDVPAGGAEFAVPAKLGVRGNTVRFAPAAWAKEALGTLAMAVKAKRQAPADVLADSLQVILGVAAHLRANVTDFAGATLVDVAAECEFEFMADTADFAALAGTGLVPLPQDAALAAELGAVGGSVANALNSKVLQPLPACTAGDCGRACVLASSELSAAREWDLPAATLPKASATLHETCDVVVAGYGTGGVMAALTAAEEGMRVAVLDPALEPGGICTAGKIHSYYHGVHAGIQNRIDEATKAAAAPIAPAVAGYHPLAKSSALMQALAKEKVQRFTGHFVFGVLKEGSRVTGVISAAEDGYHVFPCTVAIDGTGDGDLAAAAGAEFSFGRVVDGFPQPYSYTPTRIANGRLTHHNFDAGWVDPTDTLAYSRAHFLGRSRLWGVGPFSDANHYPSLAPLLGLRESRFIRGSVVLTFDDFMQGRTWPDTVCASVAHYDNHAIDYAQESDWGLQHVVMFGLWQQVCKGDMHQLGEVCGTAAALAVKSGKAPAALDVQALQARLKERGILPPQPAQALFNVPQTEMLATLGAEKNNGLAMWRLTQLSADKAPDWDALIAAEPKPERRFVAAVTAAVRGTGTTAVRGVLEQAITERWNDPKLGVKSPARCIVAVLALAEIAPDAALPRLGELLQGEINPLDAMMLFRAIGDIRSPQGAEFIRDYLKRHAGDEMGVPLWGAGPGYPASLRFLVELCAARILNLLGAPDGRELARKYAHDANLLTRRHARRLAGA